jgi:starvation-inducible DNA-binding protein
MATPKREALPEHPRRGSQPWIHQRSQEIQSFGAVRQFPLGLTYNARLLSCGRLNQILSDSQILYALYKKHHWLMRGPTFYQLHLLLDKHAGEQIKLIDEIAERVQTLGGIAVGDPRHVARNHARAAAAERLRRSTGHVVSAARSTRAYPRRRPRCCQTDGRAGR